MELGIPWLHQRMTMGWSVEKFQSSVKMFLSEHSAHDLRANGSEDTPVSDGVDTPVAVPIEKKKRLSLSTLTPIIETSKILTFYLNDFTNAKLRDVDVSAKSHPQSEKVNYSNDNVSANEYFQPLLSTLDSLYFTMCLSRRRSRQTKSSCSKVTGRRSSCGRYLCLSMTWTRTTLSCCCSMATSPCSLPSFPSPRY